ncbi:MAG TPA: cellulase family glycosylhydrolase [Nitrolancea sp.]|nr:cellulase family glycosylhydrolase [Nitrolancea sp.]
MARLRLIQFRAKIQRLPLFRLALLLILIGALGLSWLADGYFNRGVASGANLTPIPNTDVNPLGVNTLMNDDDPATIDRTLDMVAAGGFTYVRQMFPWYAIEPVKDQFQWAQWDRIVAAADARHLELIVRLDKPPRWARAGQPNVDQVPDGPPNDDADYARFVAAVVSRYRGKIHYIQIWNEPNLAGEWGGLPIDPARFARLLETAYRAAKQADPAITVLLPGLAPTDAKGPDNLSDLTYLQDLYAAGAKNSFDIVSAMVYGYGYSPGDRRVSFDRDNFSRPIQTHEIMVRNGDGAKPVWAAEYGWVSLPKDWQGQPSPWGKPVSLKTQAEYLEQGYLRAQKEWPWMGVMCVWDFRWPYDPSLPDQAGNPTRGFSLVNYDFTPNPAYTVLSQARSLLDRAYTGAYRADTRLIQHDDGWALAGTRLTAARDGATLRIPFSGTRLDLLTSGDGGFAVTLDGQARPAVPAGGRVTVAKGLSDGPHLLQLTARAGVPALDGFVVARRPLSAWIFPYVYGALGVLILLDLLGLARVLRRARRRRALPVGQALAEH